MSIASLAPSPVLHLCFHRAVSVQGSQIEHDGEDQYIAAELDDAAVAPEDAEAEEIRPSDLLVAAGACSTQHTPPPHHPPTHHHNTYHRSPVLMSQLLTKRSPRPVQSLTATTPRCAVKAEEDAAGLEVWLFEEPDAEGERTAYVHHDIPLPSFPLAVAWMRFNPSGMSFLPPCACLCLTTGPPVVTRGMSADRCAASCDAAPPQAAACSSLLAVAVGRPAYALAQAVWVF